MPPRAWCETVLLNSTEERLQRSPLPRTALSPSATLRQSQVAQIAMRSRARVSERGSALIARRRPAGASAPKHTERTEQGFAEGSDGERLNRPRGRVTHVHGVQRQAYPHGEHPEWRERNPVTPVTRAEASTDESRGGGARGDAHKGDEQGHDRLLDVGKSTTQHISAAAPRRRQIAKRPLMELSRMATAGRPALRAVRRVLVLVACAMLRA